MATTTLNRADKVLVVDDDARIRDLLRRYLTQEGFEVMVAEDGKALNRLLLRETVDIIVLDLMMPGEDGLSICRRLRAANDRTPIIMLTAKGEDVDRIVGLEMGADDYLGKPFNPRELLARIHAVLRRRPTQEAPGAPSGENEVVHFGRDDGDQVYHTSIFAPILFTAKLYIAILTSTLMHRLVRAPAKRIRTVPRVGDGPVQTS